MKFQINNNTFISHRKQRLAVGIDLGTTNSLVAVVRDNNQVQTLPDLEGRHLLPSVVHYHKHGYCVGYNALNKIIQDPANTISSVKRIIGRSFQDIQNLYPNLPYKIQANENGSPMIITCAGLLNPIRVSADILRTLAKRATEVLQNELDGVVITIPAYFDDVQRQATKDASLLAGLNVIRMLNEPTAAAIAYGLGYGKEGIIAVYDLGGGTFDISILRLSKGIFEVLATGGNSALGGDDFDYLLVNYIRDLLNIKDKKNFSDIYIQRELLKIAITTKTTLSSVESTIIELLGHTYKITRSQFNELITPLVKSTIMTCYRSLKDAGVTTKDILEVIMVGGSTRIPLVQEYVKKFFGCTPLISTDPDKIVAIGAAIQANLLIGNKPNNEILLLDVTPLSLGLETIGGLVEKVIPRNSTIPIVRSQEFTTFKDGQTKIYIHIVQGERELVKDCRSLARFSLCGIPSLPAGAVRICVTFQIDANGLLNVTASEKSTGIKSSIKVKPSYGLTDNEIKNMIQESINYSSYDIKVRMLAEQKIEASRLLENLRIALTNEPELLTDIEHQTINDAKEALRIMLLSNNIDDIDIIKKAIEDLNKKAKKILLLDV